MPSIKLSASVDEAVWRAAATHFAGCGTSEIVQMAMSALLEKHSIQEWVPVMVPKDKADDIRRMFDGEIIKIADPEFERLLYDDEPDIVIPN